ncbi:M14 family metallopeptidase [Niabella hibiscisoli]|uniref:M14 family metallopeptidase n=1 Tax=Niabella hibiscisoli TaxID=1825928 RepID=UPI001F0D7042|nr:M14 family metallopeptidase [Niabella hibiscisoli]MCH5715439.1 M14 family metallopeptidase [Niabella hibiscisoli]
MKTMGMTDAGLPLHLVTISDDGVNNYLQIRKEKRLVILINNGIHPGEPDGIDASMLLAAAIAKGKLKLPNGIVLAIIPVYNIGGCLNRSAHYRIDQNGPEAFGFRGNAQNLDLNRDFIKADAKEALSFAQIFHLTDPAILIDNHVSNGADYQHVMTLLTSQHNKLGGEMGKYLNEVMEPALYSSMKKKGYDLVPYVNFDHRDKVEKGWEAFWDAPRYSSGYAALWNTFAFVPETHMLKPYPQRVQSTYELMKSFIEFAGVEQQRILELRTLAKEKTNRQESFIIGWELDKTRPASITFKGYESGYKPSEVSGLPRLYYDRAKPYTLQVPFFNSYQSTAMVQKPRAYIIPQGWWRVIERLKVNNIAMQPIQRDTIINVDVYRIEEYKAASRPYEGHHPNQGVRLSTSSRAIQFRKGDWYIPMNQPANRFLIEVLEPAAEDSYFKWNFFDAILQQKEGYSDYHFEDVAAGYLQSDKDLQQKLEARRSQDTAFAQSAAPS